MYLIESKEGRTNTMGEVGDIRREPRPDADSVLWNGKADGAIGGGGYIPMIVVDDESTNAGYWSLDEKMGQTYIHYEQANTLAARDYKQPQIVIIKNDEEDDNDDLRL